MACVRGRAGAQIEALGTGGDVLLVSLECPEMQIIEISTEFPMQRGRVVKRQVQRL